MVLKKWFSSRRNFDLYKDWSFSPTLLKWESGCQDVQPIVAKQIYNNDCNKQSPTIIIALGETGEQTLRFLKTRFSSCSLGASLRALLIAVRQYKDDSEDFFYAIDIKESGGLGEKYVYDGANLSERIQLAHAFARPENYKRYQVWLQDTLLDLGENVQVFIVGSLSESTVGLLGGLLRILHSFRNTLGRANLFNKVSVFLSTYSVNKQHVISDAEQFAAIREIARFTFNGPHYMNESLAPSALLHQTLIDYVFLFDEKMFMADKPNAAIMPEQVLAEGIAVLARPGAVPLWEKALNDLHTAATVRDEMKEAVFHSFGVATLYMPLSFVRQYFAAKLSLAALFGDADLHVEGVLKMYAYEESDVLDINLIRTLLLQIPPSHPVIEWFINLRNYEPLHELPDLPSKFDRVFLHQLSYGLYKVLNDKSKGIRFAEIALSQLEKYLKERMQWLQHSDLIHTEQGQQIHLRFASWLQQVITYKEQIEQWSQALFGIKQKNSPDDNKARSDKNLFSWRTGLSYLEGEKSSTGWRSTSSESIKQSDFLNLKDWFQRRQTQAHKNLTSALDNQVVKSMLNTKSQDGSSSLEQYYYVSINARSYIERIEERIEWWVDIDGRQQISLVCLPATVSGSARPSLDYRFVPDQAENFANEVMKLAESQTHFLDADITRVWFAKKIRGQIKFLRRAADAYLLYDEAVTAYSDNLALRRSYLVSKDRELSLDLLRDVFPDVSRVARDVLDDDDNTRFSALTLRMNIPFGAIQEIRQMQAAYSQEAQFVHIHPQEKIAAKYEQCVWRFYRKKISFAPPVCSILVDSELVSLFFQILFSGLLLPERDSYKDSIVWKVAAVPLDDTPEFAPLFLVETHDEDNLFWPLRKFVLELPYAPDVNRNPKGHFYPKRRGQYIALLKEQARKYLYTLSATPPTENLREEWLERLKKRAQYDVVADALYWIAMCESKEPLGFRW